MFQAFKSVFSGLVFVAMTASPIFASSCPFEFSTPVENPKAVMAALESKCQTGAAVLLTSLVSAKTDGFLPKGLAAEDAKLYFEVLFHPKFLDHLVEVEPEHISRWDSVVDQLEALYFLQKPTLALGQ